MLGGLADPARAAAVRRDPVARYLETASGLSFDSSPSLAADAQFPCDLTKAAKLPKLTLSGETHGNKAADLDKMMRVIEASKGKYHLGLEGVNYGTPTSEITLFKILKDADPKVARIFGYDAPFPYGLGLLLVIDNTLKVELSAKQSPLETQVNFFLNAVDNAYIPEAWANIRKSTAKFDDAAAEAIATLFDEILIKRRDTIEAIKALPKNHAFFADPVTFMALIGVTGHAYVDMAKSEKYKGPMLVNKDIDLASEAFLGEHSEKVVQAVAVDWRNLHLVHNIAKLYCAALGESKELFVVMGQLHVAGLHKMLDQMSGKRVPIAERDPEIDKFEIFESTQAPAPAKTKP